MASENPGPGKSKEELIEALAEMVAERANKAAKAEKPLMRFLKFSASNWVLFTFMISVVSLILGWMFYDISPLRPIQEIAQRQEEHRYRKRMVSRHLELGRMFLNVCNLKAARIEFENALRLDPNSVDAQLGRFKSEIFEPIAGNDYDPELMEKRLQLVLEENPNDPHVIAFLAIIYQNIDKGESKRYFQKAIHLDSTMAMALAGLAMLYDESKSLDSALIYYETAARYSKWNQMYLNNLGYQYLQRRQFDKAIEKYDLLIRLDNRLLISYYTMANALRHTGRAEAAYEYQAALITHLGDTSVTNLQRNNGGWLFHTPDGIVRMYNLDARKYYAYYSMALTCTLLNRPPAARAYIDSAESLRLADRTALPLKRLLHFDIAQMKKSDSILSEPLDAFLLAYLSKQ